MPKTHTDSSDSDDTPPTTFAQSCPSPQSARMDASRQTVEKMEGWLSQADFRRLRRSRSSLRALVFLRDRRERNPNLFPAAALVVANLSPHMRGSPHTEEKFPAPRICKSPRSSAAPVWLPDPPAPSCEFTQRTLRQKAFSQQQHQQQPARLLDPFLRQPQSSTVSSPRSDSHDRTSPPLWIGDRPQRPLSTDHSGTIEDDTPGPR